MSGSECMHLVVRSSSGRKTYSLSHPVPSTEQPRKRTEMTSRKAAGNDPRQFKTGGHSDIMRKTKSALRNHGNRGQPRGRSSSDKRASHLSNNSGYRYPFFPSFPLLSFSLLWSRIHLAGPQMVDATTHRMGVFQGGDCPELNCVGSLSRWRVAR